MTRLDLAIRGGLIVTAEERIAGDLGVAGGRIAHVGGRVPRAAGEIDASGLWVLPGGVDPHVHLTPSHRRRMHWVDDFTSGSHAAAAGGITTIGNISSPRRGEDIVPAMQRIEREAMAASLVDFVLHPVIADPSNHDRFLSELAMAGFGSMKVFMISPEFERNFEGFLRAMATAADLGLVVMLHCEDAAMNAFAAERLIREGHGAPIHYAASRPRRGETAAVSRAVAMCEVTSATTYVVHVAGRDALATIRAARSDGLPIYAETRPLYLHLTEDVLRSREGALFIGSPPIGSESDQAALWDGLRTGDISTVGSDHAAWMRKDKLDPARDVLSALPGVPELETLIALLLSEGVGKGRISLEQLVSATSTMPARIFGIFPRKGTIALGSDADIAIWDPEGAWVVRAEEGQSRADYSPYERRTVRGQLVHTIRRGEVIWSGGRATGGAGRGRRVRSTTEHSRPRVG
jgi:dihydropyrimidinase